MDINNPFETFQRYAFRLEALPQYIVAEEIEPLRYFEETGLMNDRDTEWPELIRSNTLQGKKVERLRLLSEKLTDYERYEIQAYRGPSVGEDIRTALVKDFADQYKYDFWFFDDEWIAQVNYEADGTFINFDVRTATQQEKDMFMYWHGVFENAKPLRQIPFVSNTPDDTHCLQAAYMSIAKYFDPTFAVSMEEWSVLTGYEEGLGTWANAGIVWFKEHGYDVKHIEQYDFAAFIDHPREYMIEHNGDVAGLWGYEHTNVPAEIERMKKLLETDIVEQREPTFDDVKRYIDDGYLVRISINCQKLDREEGYIGHAVVITGYNDTYVTFHDPGLPAIPNRQATYAELDAAWADPSPQIKELDAIKRL
jgi:hypothetical protein